MPDALDNAVREPAEPETKVPHVVAEVQKRLAAELTAANIEQAAITKTLEILGQVLPLLLAAAAKA
jgi:hypothetical protein